MPVLEHLRLHTRIHLKFLARSRVLLGFVILIAVGMAVSLVPALFLDTFSNRFEMLKGVALQLHGAARMLTAGIGLFVLWSHRRQRSIKMVTTKPSPLESWVGSVFLSAALAGLAAHAAVAAATYVLSLYWGLPYEIGFLYVAMDRFVESLIALGVLTALSAVLHPIIATLLVLFFNESMFESLGTILTGVSESGRGSPIAAVSMKILRTLYYVVPSYGPFNDKTEALERSLRVAFSDWKYLAASCGYTLLACAACYFVTLVVLRRRPLI
jgi:hypothetical protein